MAIVIFYSSFKSRFKIVHITSFNLFTFLTITI